MAAQLQPLVELAVVGQERPLARVIEDEGGAGQVPGVAGAMQRVGVLEQEGEHLRTRPRVRVVARNVGEEQSPSALEVRVEGQPRVARGEQGGGHAAPQDRRSLR